MITVIPERVLQQSIIEGFQTFRRSPKLLATLFQNLTDAEFQRITNFITQAPISISVNYPRGELRPPVIVLLLKGEQETEPFLGDYMGSTGFGLNAPEHMFDTQSGHSASVAGIQGLPPLIIGPLNVGTATDSSVSFTTTSQELWLDLYSSDRVPSLTDLYLGVISGAGKGNVYPVRRLSPTSVDIEDTFNVNLDSTSVVELRQVSTTLPVGEPARVFTPNSVLTRKGAQYTVNYQLDVIAGSQEEVIYLYFVLKAIFFLQKNKLEEQGIIGLTMTGSDFAPRGEFVPDEVFHRVLNLSFHYPFSILEEETELYTRIALSIEAEDGTIGSASEVLLTTITLS